MIGIYKITSPSGKIYIGQSVDIDSRLAHYKRLDCKGQVKLFNSLKKYEAKNHTFEVVEECSVFELSNREGYWQDFYNSIHSGLNCRRVSTKDKSGYDAKETVEKRASKLRGVKRPSISGEKHHNFGKTMPKYLKDKISNFRKSQTGELNHSSKLVICLISGIFYESIQEASVSRNMTYKQLYTRLVGTAINNTSLVLVDNYEKGKLVSKVKANIRGGNNPNSKTLLDTESGIYYSSIKDAAESLGISCGILRDMLRGKQKNKTNLIYDK